MTLSKARPTIIALWLTYLSVLAARAEVPAGWIVAGSSPQDYEFSRDSSTASNGHYSAVIAAKAGIVPNGFGTLMQTINAENYRGARCRLSAYLRTTDATRAQMWMRVDGPDRKVVSFDNMDARPVTGTTGWTRYEIVLDVPSDSVDIAFGFLLTQAGKAWGDNFRLEKVEATVPLTSPATAVAVLPKEPVNIDFESTADSGHEPEILKAESVDTYDMYRINSHLGPINRKPGAFAVDLFGGAAPRNDTDNKYNLCGMHVVAQTREPDGATLKWELKLSVYTDGTSRLAGIAAGSFTLPPHTRNIIPRRPITGLVIRLDGMTEPASARIYGVPNSDNGVVGDFPEAYAEKLFDAFDAGTPFTVDVTYDSGEHETVRMRARGGIGTTGNFFFHGPDAPTRRCLGSLVPASKSGLQNRVVELPHPT